VNPVKQRCGCVGGVHSVVVDRQCGGLVDAASSRRRLDVVSKKIARDPSWPLKVSSRFCAGPGGRVNFLSFLARLRSGLSPRTRNAGKRADIRRNSSWTRLESHRPRPADGSNQCARALLIDPMRVLIG
jgi:hypothetical protein